MMQDIEQYINKDDDYKGKIIQSIIGMNNIFRGWITKNWVHTRVDQPKKMHTLNKLIIKHSVTFYSKV